jgi:hypothetical protein
MKNEDYCPQTEIELEKWMKDNCFNFTKYAINGNFIHMGYGIEKFGGLYIWYYTERGEQNKLKYFFNEKEITEYAYAQIKSDKWAKTHCIGFTIDKEKSLELVNELKDLQIEFLQDEVPDFPLGHVVFRIFVLGCDIMKTSHLKEKYYEEK